MSAAATVWTVGHLTVDDVLFWDGAVDFRSPGGDALYAAVGASLLGATVRVATRLGEGFPISALDGLQHFGVELVPSAAPERCISQWVLYEKDGSRIYLLHPDSGSLGTMSPAPEDYRIPAAAAVHFAPMPVSHQLDWCLSERGRHRVMTVDPHEDSCRRNPHDVLAMAACVDAFLPSEIEARLLAGDDPVEAALAFRSAGAPIAAVKLGQDGSVVATAEGVWHVPAVSGEVVDTTGAGDSYCGGFAAALSIGEDGLAAAKWATAVASFMVGTRGMSIPSADDARSTVAERARSITPALLTGLNGEPNMSMRQPMNRRAK